ncbi:MAG: LacI family transcriptional regulator [Betaproteobacteria bacterium]|nr:LacI family transcriptional regulator [Betaproteobacteria bacterium]
MKKWSVVAVMGMALGAVAANAQNFPTKPVHMFIGFPAGTSTDILARMLAQKLGDLWGQNVVADNRAGAGSSIAAAAVARSTPDGYTLLFNSSAQSINPSLYAKLPYDTLKDFVEIAAVASQPNVLVVNPGSSIKSVAELIAEAKAKPGQLNFGSAGVGTGTHLNLEKFKLATGVDITHVPYKGTPEVVTDIIGGRTTGYFAPITAALPFVQGGKLRALAVSSAKRSSQLPNVPTVAEAGVKGFDFQLWFGLWGPSGMPKAVIDKIARDTNRVLASAELREQFAKASTDPLIMTRAEFGQFVRKEIDENGRVIRSAGIQPQ